MWLFTAFDIAITAHTARSPEYHDLLRIGVRCLDLVSP